MTKVVLALDNGCGYDDYQDLCYIQVDEEYVDKVKELAEEQVNKHRKLWKEYYKQKPSRYSDELRHYNNKPIELFQEALSNAGIYAEFFIPSEWISIQTY